MLLLFFNENNNNDGGDDDHDNDNNINIKISIAIINKHKLNTKYIAHVLQKRERDQAPKIV